MDFRYKNGDLASLRSSTHPGSECTNARPSPSRSDPRPQAKAEVNKKDAIDAGTALHFAACSLFCRVYADGALVHNHTIGGFTPFEVALPPSASGLLELVVLTCARIADACESMLTGGSDEH